MSAVLLDRDGSRAEREAAALANQHGVHTVGLAVDAADGGAVGEAASAVADRFGRADLVVSNVGVQLFGAVERLTDDERYVVTHGDLVDAVASRCSELRRAAEIAR